MSLRRPLIAATAALGAFSARVGAAEGPRPLDWRALLSVPERVVYLGDSHDFKDERVELARSMESFRAAGITHLALEMFPADAQSWLDRHRADGGCRATMRWHLQTYWEAGPDPLADEYLSLIDRAQAAGIRVVALDIRERDKQRLRPQEPEPGCAWHLPIPEEEYEPALASCSSGGEDRRECAMAYRLARLLQDDPGARVAVLVGAWHVASTRQPRLLENRYGAPSRSYSFLTLLVNFNAENRNDGVAAGLIAQIKNAGLKDRSQFVPLERASLLHDGVLWIPSDYRDSDWSQRDARRWEPSAGR